MVDDVAYEKPIRRLWLIVFSNGHGPPKWWHCLLKRGFRHVSALAYFAGENRWVYYDPTSRGTVIELWTHDDVWRRFGQIAQDATVILRVKSSHERTIAPFSWWCVGAIKALLGFRSSALCPNQLHKHLLSHGAEIVEREHGDPIQDRSGTSAQSETATDAAG